MDSENNNNTVSQLKPIEIPQSRELTKDDLPSIHQLETLLAERGREALISYAWRNALRVLPVIAIEPFQETWLEHKVEHSYSIVRVAILLHGVLNRSQRTYAADDCAPDAWMPETYATSPASDAISQAAYSLAAAYSCAYNIDANVDSYPINSRGAIVDAAVKANVSVIAAFTATYKSIAYHTDPRIYKINRAIYSQAITDFNTLANGESVSGLYKKGIWFKHLTGSFAETFLDEYQEIQDRLYAELKKVGLDFVIEDLRDIYRGSPIDDKRLHLHFDSLNLSEDVLNDAVKLGEYFGGGQRQANRAVRVLLVGPGGAGKTSLFQLLTKRECESGKGATVSIDTAQVDVSLHQQQGVFIDEEQQGMDISLWDFGGQSIFYNLHRGFMRRENCVYVLVVDSRHEQAPEEWLGQIRAHTLGHQKRFLRIHPQNQAMRTKVLLVTNVYDGVEREQNKTYLLRQYSDLLTDDSFYTFNCTDADDQDAMFNHFVQKLINTCQESQRRIMARTHKAIDKLQAEFESENFIYTHQLADIFQMDDESEDWRDEKSSLENLGFIVPSGNDGYCLKPAWITNTAYQAINHQYLRDRDGLVTYSQMLSEVLKGENDAEKITQFLIEQKVARPIKHNDRDNLFFPDAAQSQEPYDIEQLLVKADDVEHVTIEYQFDTFPMGFKSHLAIGLLEKDNVFMSGDKPMIWRDGLCAEFKEHDVKALVFYHLAQQKLLLKLIYSILPGEPLDDENQTEIAESSLAEPLKVVHDLITQRVNAIPILIDNFERLDESQRSAIFDKIEGYKKVSQEKGEVNNIGTQNIFEAPVENVIESQQKNHADNGSTINASQVTNSTNNDSFHSSEEEKPSKTGLPAWAQWFAWVGAIVGGMFAGLRLFGVL